MKKATLVCLCIFLKSSKADTANKTITSYDPADLLSRIFNPNVTIASRQRGYGFVKFEDQYDPGVFSDEPGQYGLVFEDKQRPLRFEDNYDSQSDPSTGEYGLADNQKPLRFEDNYDSQNGPNTERPNIQNRPLKFEDSEYNQDVSNTGSQINFQDDNKVDNQGNKKKKRRRRRKPKKGVLPDLQGGLGYQNPGFDGGSPGPVQGGYGLYPHGNPEYSGQPYRRPRRPRPRPSIASEALSAVTEALTSIALYDDYQCVPRLLCEAAGGGSLGGSGVLQSIAGIQPLLTLLSAYNGISTSPLFVFGRAVFLGMTSKGNTGTCRYAYSQCPTDPEQLIYYLNNHNGGFFRFFSANPNQNLEQFYNQGQGYPQNNYQNLEQFYNQLGQGYGPQPNGQQGYPNVQNYGLPYGQNYDIHRPYGQNDNQNYGLQRPSLYGNQNSGSNYAYDYNNYDSANKIRFKDNNRIEKRIQNKPIENVVDDAFYDNDDEVKSKWSFPDNISEQVNDYNAFDDDDDGKTKWSFPDSISEHISDYNNNDRDSRTLRFPEENQSQSGQKDRRNGKSFQFLQNFIDKYYNNRQQTSTPKSIRYQTTTYSYNNGENNNQNYYTNRPNTNVNINNDKYLGPNYYNYDYKPNNDNYQNNQNYYNNNNNYQSNPNSYSNKNKYQNNQNYYDNNQNIYNNNHKYPTTTFNNDEYVFDHKHNFYVKREKNKINNFNPNENNNGLKIVYVVRGNGDPNKPEIVKVRPGQSVY